MTNKVRAAVVLAAVGLYAVLWLAWSLHWGWLGTLDDPALEISHAYGIQHPAWVTCWDVFCTALGPTTFRLVGLVVAIIEVMRHRWRAGLFLAISIGFSGPVSVLAKAVADRPRPAIGLSLVVKPLSATALVAAPSSSFPSGHAVGVLVGVLALQVVVAPLLSGRTRLVVRIAGVVVVTAIGVGRVVLDVHHPSDVLAGWALGYAFYYVCLMVITPGTAQVVSDVRAEEVTPRATPKG